MVVFHGDSPSYQGWENAYQLDCDDVDQGYGVVSLGCEDVFLGCEDVFLGCEDVFQDSEDVFQDSKDVFQDYGAFVP